MSPNATPANIAPSSASAEVTFVAPLLMVTDMERSLHFYVDGLGFEIKNRWIPDGHLRWCWMTLGTAPLMLQQAMPKTQEKLAADGKLGNGVGFYFQCSDALVMYKLAKERGISGQEPQVGNNNWEVFLRDPDGYGIIFCSPTDVPEETLLSEIEK